MSQQVFSDFIGLSPATLSGIFNDRTRPTLSIVEAIKKKIPNISLDWLMFGKGAMFLHEGSDDPSTLLSGGGSQHQAANPMEPALDFAAAAASTPYHGGQPMPNGNGVRNTRLDIVREDVKYLDKPQRRVTEIRVYYDDQTWESFVPSKK